MDSCGPEIEKLVFSNNNPSTVDEKENEERVEVKEIDEEEKGKGVITNLISAFVSGGKDVEIVNEDQGIVKAEEEKNNGGLINHLISMVNPPAEADNGDHRKSSEEKEEENGVNGGMIHNFISNMLNNNNNEEEKKEATMDGEGNGQKVKERGEGGGVVDNVISHFPNPLSDDAAPALEEASILIHSIVHD